MLSEYSEEGVECAQYNKHSEIRLLTFRTLIQIYSVIFELIANGLRNYIQEKMVSQV